ncbi:hypothetical protein BG023_111012 [Porphyrobacter sp. LM 6]|nr:hypothetical protein BG023_111012 [Porphyrobacter sp. LM 6]
MFNCPASISRQSKDRAQALVFGDLIALKWAAIVMIERAGHHTPLAQDLLGNAAGLVGDNATGKSTKSAAIRIKAVEPGKKIGQQILADIGFSLAA